MEYLEQAIQRTEGWIAVIAMDHPDRARRFQILDMLSARIYQQPDLDNESDDLREFLSTQLERTGEIDDLNREVDVANMAVMRTPPNHPDQAGYLTNLGDKLGTRFLRTGAIEDLNRAVDVSDKAVTAIPSNHPGRAVCLNNVGVWLGTRFQWTGAMEDLNRAVDVSDKAVTATPSDHPNRAIHLNNLGRWLGARFKRTGTMEDLNRAIDIADKAVTATPPDHPDQASHLSNLGIWLGGRFERTGAIEDLNRAVDVSDKAVTVTPSYHPSQAAYLSNLGNRLGRRFERTGAIEDLNRAVDVIDKAVTATPPDHPDRAAHLANLGGRLFIRFERTGVIEDLNRAVDAAEKAVTATPPDHHERAIRLANLGAILSRRFERTGAIEDLNRAVNIADEAVTTTPCDHPDRAGWLNNLGILLSMQFKRTGLIDDINRAIDAAGMAINATPQDHPDRAHRLENLGKSLYERFERTESIDDLNHALYYFKEGWACHSSPPSIRIRLAHHAANILASQLNWEESSDFLQGAVKLLPLVSPRLLENSDKQHMLGQFAGLASMAAAISLKAGKDGHNALELLELGRCVITGLLLEMRTDISDLKEQYPRLAAEFEFLRNELDSPSSGIAPLSDSAPSWKLRANRRFEADQKFNEVIAKIRSQPGFQNFLLPPTRDELMVATDQGPIIIINVSVYRSDAFLIKHHQIRVLPLPNLREEELEERVQRLSVGSTLMLQWLWDVAAGPILDALGYQHPPSDDNWPHIWWILTGTLSHCPIHAAGFHTEGSTETVLDRVMSSYSSSIKTLVYERRLSVRRPAEFASEHALLVAMQDTPGNSVLPFATREVEMLANLCPSLQLKPVMPPQHREEVLAHLRECKIFHFAGHGRSDLLDPSRSSLLLKDWEESPLTVGHLHDYKIQESSPFLAYLSACSTGANKVDELIDEGIHLVGAFQLAGFRHVIGTLWEVSDSHCVDVARVVYETIRDEGITDMAICRGLHRAVRALRDGHVESAKERDAVVCDEGCESTLQNRLYWAPYIHFGV